MTLVLTVIVFITCIVLLAIGVVFSRKPIKSSCCASSELDKDKAACAVTPQDNKE
ncbi:hypothetical protein K6Q96_22870 [Grimontia kaedaensis]|uniref:Na(+)-translocating NADH-quinone reductase subunit E n=1 Tax=Grimontia kaedaensis TaxID=2872157 RepID=A0ABY4WZY9_9GAMM|nr:hypothetical protein [Grimontia kaedaensis]USH04568.1 hypothetical protein K6Q96_22870 [Grimontia kaedaensis]